MTRNYFSENEEIWEDLLYWLKNPITESEQKLRDEELNTYIENVLNKTFV